MALAPGTRLGVYEILTPIGAGGMGEVYQARDTRLKRDVALKVLPDTFAQDPDRLARFQREAELLATLNHPNIAGIYGLEESNGVRALVLELVEGPTLADRIANGPIPLDDALPVARQIAEALEAAHEQGIIHRDLKPANIKVRPDGTVKVLDFGLAKAFDPSPSAGAAMTDSPTLSMQATFAGVILGTAAYMSPEQASGKPIDKRSDIWSFGVVLWEMLMGARLFAAETISHTLADVLRAPIDVTRLPPDTPWSTVDLLRRCLDRDVKRRLRDIGEARVAIERAMGDPQAGTVALTAGQTTAGHRPWWRLALPILASATLGAAVSGLVSVMVRTPAAVPMVTRFTFTLPAGQLFSGLPRHIVDVSPDGTEIVYAANLRLYRRALRERDATLIAGSENRLGVASPVFSPDGRWIAFSSGVTGRSAIQKIQSNGGAAVALSAITTVPNGMSWSAGGVLFAQGSQGVQRVSVNGGVPEHLVSVKVGKAATFPQMLPGGNAVLYTLVSPDQAGNDSEIVVRSLKIGAEKTIIKTGSDARYLPTGHIVYALGGVLFAVPFDLKKLETTGDPVPVVEGIRRGGVGVGGPAQFSVSNNGVLAYIPGPATVSQALLDVAFVDRSGKVEPLKFPAGLYEAPRVSPNGKQLAVASLDGNEVVIWIYDLSGTTSIRRLTFGGRNRFPIWSPNGERVAFQSDREGDLAIFSQRADGTGPAERLTKPGKDASHVPDSWSPAGDRILLTETKGRDFSAWTVSVQEKTVTAFGNIRSFLPIDAVFSPDGKWVAYQSGKGGDNAVYVQPFPATGAIYQISKGNAHHPVWSRDGKEIIYLPANSLPLVASIATQPSFTVGNAPVQLPVKGDENGPTTIRNYDMLPDGRLVGVVVAGQPPLGVLGTQQIDVVVNWFEELKQRVPTK